MPSCRILAALALLATPVAAQTPPAAQSPGQPAGQPLASPGSTPAPMPDPLMAPDLQAQGVHAPTLTTLVQQSAWQDATVAVARAQFSHLPERCAAASFKPTGELTVYVPAEFDPKGALTAGVWNERVAVTGCGAPVSLNILTVLQAGSPPSRIPVMPGDSHADPATQRSALQYAQAIAVRASPPNCREEMFTGAKFDGYTGLPIADIRDGRPNRAWREVWSLTSCGVPYAIEMTFTPNAQGMQLSATNPVKRP